MNVLKINYKKLFGSILTLALLSCSNPWDGRQNNGDVNLDSNLSQAIASNTQLSKFNELLTKTGYDKILSESKTYTVFAPTNDAMAQVDPSILNNPDQLLLFVQNHITLTSYSSIRSQDVVTLKMLSNKYLDFKGSTTIGDATIVTADKYAANGIFHIVNKALTPKQNIWQYVNSISSTSAMSNFLLSLSLKDSNIYKSDIDAKTTAVPGMYADSLTNSYLKNVYNLNNEKNSYTLFLMDDAGYSTEVDKLKPYLTKLSPDSTATFARFFTTRDMVFPKAYKLNELPSVLTSRFGVNVTIDKTQIVGQPIVLSNGIIYRMKTVNVKLTDRLVTTKIEGENNTSFIPSDLRSKIWYREKIDPSGIIFPIGTKFNDIAVYDPKTSLFMLNYAAKDLFSTTYKVYWRAVNVDFPNASPIVFQQRLLIGSLVIINNVLSGKIAQFPYTDVPIGNYNDVYIGTFKLDKSGDINNISLLSANTTTAGNNSLALDYLKFVPVP